MITFTQEKKGNEQFVHLILFARENESNNLYVDEWVDQNDNWIPTQKLLPGFMVGGFIANDYETSNM